MLKKVFFLFSFTLSSIFAQDFERIAPHEPSIAASEKINLDIPVENVNDDKVLIPCLKGILLMGCETSVDPEKIKLIKGIEVADLDIPGCMNSLREHLCHFINNPLTKQGLVDLKREVILYYREYDRPVIHVYIPPQNITAGGVQIVVYESKLCDLKIVNNCYFKTDKLKKYFRLKQNAPIDTNVLVKDLEWLNRNPFRQMDAVFIPSVHEGMTDIEIVSHDRFPFRLYSGVENTGLEDSGHNRWFLGFNWGNAFGLDHIFSYQFTSGSNYDEFWAHSLNYTAPLSWRHVLNVFGGVSEVHAILPEENKQALLNENNAKVIKTHGFSAQGSLRYEIPILAYRNLLQELTFGFDYKRTNTSLNLDGAPFKGDICNLTQLMMGYNSGMETNRVKYSLIAEIFVSPGEWLPDQENERYNSLRRYAKNTYVYGRGALCPIFRLPKCFTVEPTLRFQLSSQNLLASEQIGLGGYNSVRGYEERQVNVDNAIILNLELRTPQIPLFSYFEKAKCLNEGILFLLFFDYGYGKNHKLQYDEKKVNILSGIGPGVRYNLSDHVSFRGDWGFQLERIEDNDRSYMFHFGLVLSF